jgi:hypothetical protein
MRRFFLIAGFFTLLAACDYTTPLVTAPAVEIDPAAVGAWQRTNAYGHTEALLVLPLNRHEYLISFPAGAKHAMFARATVWRGKDMALVQADWFGTAEGKVPDDRRTFQYADYSVEGDKLTVRLLNPEVISKDIHSAEALAQAIADNRQHPQLFREAMVFHRESAGP